MRNNQAVSVCHLASGDLWAGAEVQLFSVLKELAQDNEIKVGAIIFNEGELSRRLSKLNIKLEVIDEKINIYPIILLKTIIFLRKNKFKILHVHRYKENITAVIAGLFSNSPLIIRTQHGLTHTKQGFPGIKMRFYDLFDNIVKKLLTDKIVCVTEDIKHILSNRFKIHSSICIYNGISKVPASLPEKRNKGKNYVIGLVGRLVSVKNVTVFIQAAYLLSKQHPETTFVVVGDGPERQFLEKKTRELGIKQKIIFMGHVTDMSEIWEKLDIYVLCSKHEGLSMALLEAMSYGIPVVVTAVGGNKEVINNKENGIVVPPNNPKAIADACNFFLLNRELSAKIGENARGMIKKRFTAEKHVIKLCALYKTLLRQRSMRIEWL
jgi:glycosyltransferase involved in cell wall biosynthesis